MIGVTQLINSNLNPPLIDGLTEATAFTSHQEVADSGLSDGYYYLNDGTRTRQYYFSVNGTAAGQSSGGWARIDSTSMPNPYSGQECYQSSGTITSNGVIKVRATSGGGLGSGNHGGCGTGYNSTYFKARYISITDYGGATNSGTGPNDWANTTYLYLYDSPATLRSDWYGNQAGNGGYYYPGAYAFASDSTALSLALNNANGSSTSYPSFPSTSGSTSSNYSLNGNNGYRLSPRGYDLFNTADRILHVGQSVYLGTNPTEVFFTVWFKF